MMRPASTVLLAIDTSTRIVGLALYDGIQVLSESSWSSIDYHTVELAPAVAEALKKASLTNDETLGALAVALGPGSFTGLRIGMALAKGLALARHLPIIGVPTLDILAAAQSVQPKRLAAVLRAGRGRLAVGWYEAQNNNWKRVQDIEVCTPEELAYRIDQPTTICGELSEAERIFFNRDQPNVELASPAKSLRRCGFLAELAWQRWKAGLVDNPASLSPIYLHYHDPIPG
jgi:tRNA threonylcarbamoyladenosine biosynthesis protein TsaB